MKKNNLNKPFMAIAIALGFTHSAFAAEVPAGVELAEKQELVRGNGSEPASLDPHIGESSVEHAIYNELFETLTITDPNGELIPGAAVSWSSPDSKVWTIKLRPEAKWSNGDPVTAHDFVYSFRRLADPKTSAPYSSYLQYMNLANINEVIAGKQPADTLGVKAIDDLTLEITLSQPVAHLPIMLSHFSLAPVHQKTVEQFGQKWVEPANFVGNGAFKLQEHIVNEKVVVVRNPEYWNNSKTVLEKITFLPIDDASDLARYRAGEIDMTLTVPLEMFSKMKQDYPDELRVSPNLCTYYYAINNQRAPFNDVRVRNALKMSIDRDIIANKILGQGQMPAFGQTHPGINNAEFTQPEWFTWTQDQRNEEAKKLLEEAGFNEANPLKFTVTYNTSENHKKIALAASQMWKKNLGVEVTLENQEWKTFLDTLRLGNFDVARYAWCADYNEPSAFLNVFRSDSTNNSSHYKNPVFDKLLDEALTLQSDAERKAIYQQAENLLDEEAANVPVYYYVISRMVQPYIGGYTGKEPLDNIRGRDLYIIKH